MFLVSGINTANASSVPTTDPYARNASGTTNQQEVQVKNQNSPKKESYNESAEKEVRAYFKDIPELIEVARCESDFEHTDSNGNIHRGIANRADVGVMQINEKYHADEAVRLGYNIYTVEGNVAFGRYLYNKYGSDPWSSSAPCWSEGSQIAIK